MNYVATHYSRITGLGNKLFPWALAKIFADETGYPMLHQKWASVRAGPITRGGIDYSKIWRSIFLFDNFRDASNEASIFRAIGKKRILVKSLSEARQLKLRGGDYIVFFSAFGEHNFVELTQHRGFIRKEFYKIVKPKWISEINRCLPENYICMNIRWGNDFKTTDDPAVAYRKTPIEWFIQSAKSIRMQGIELPIVVVSDGGPLLLRFFKGIRNVTFFSSKSAVGDLIALAQADTILGTGASSFSAWGAFMSGHPYFCCPTTPSDKYRLPPFVRNPLGIDAFLFHN